jgi:hypothetical protein
MRFIRTALAATVLGLASLTVAGPAMAGAKPAAAVATKPSSAPAPAQSSSPAPAPVPAEAAPVPAESGPAPAQVVPKGAPETGGGPGGSPLVPLSGVLLVAGAGMGTLVLCRRANARV